MYVEINHKIKQVISKSVEKAGSERGLCKILKIPRSLYNYKTFSKTIPLEILVKLIRYMELKEEQIIDEHNLLPDNWWKRIAGTKSYETKIRKGSFESNHKKMRHASSLRMKRIFKIEKRLHKKTFYIKQYERFKKISEYKYTTKNGEKVRNLLEKQVADILLKNRILYRYEPYIECKRNVYFPDFVLDGKKTIIECTMWHGFDKANKLYHKIKDLEAKDYRVFVMITPNVKRFYNKIQMHIIDDLKVLQDNLIHMPQ